MKITHIFVELNKLCATSADKLEPSLAPRLLDVGCGNGDSVQDCLEQGYDAFGTDVEFKAGSHRDTLIAEGRVKKLGHEAATRIDTVQDAAAMNYVWPFEDASFDVVFSRATIEHVFNLEDFVQENRRVLRKDGIAVHYFPSKYALIEPHVGIPLGGIFRHSAYLRCCLYLGLCYNKYRGLDRQEAIKRIQAYLADYTCYRNESDIIRQFHEGGFRFQGAYAGAVMNAAGRNWSRQLGRFGLFRYLFSVFRSKLLVFQM